jgi:hypothetical protein
MKRELVAEERESGHVRLKSEWEWDWVLSSSVVSWAQINSLLLLAPSELRAHGARAHDALAVVVERGDAVCAELALQALGMSAENCSANAVAKVVRAISRPETPAAVLQQAFRSLAARPEFAGPLFRLAKDAVQDARPATRIECLKVLVMLADQHTLQHHGLEEGLRDFAAEDASGFVRATAVDGLLAVLQRGDSRLALASLWETGLLALDDDDVQVRKSAVKLFWCLGTRFADEDAPSLAKWKVRNRVFVLLCAAVLDPNLAVRETAARSIGSLPLPSHQYLMQSLSKKNLMEKRAEYGGGGGGGFDDASLLPANFSPEWGSELLQDQQAVGAFVHALEEEFAEVRLAALESMCELSLQYAPFAGEALDHIVDMLHDESSDVRLKAIHALRRMGAAGIGTAQLRSEHLSLLMFLLSEAHSGIRRAVQQLLQEVAHPDTSSFRTTVLCLCGNFERYPDDFDHVLAALVGLGKRHAVLVELLVEQLLGLDHPGFLVQERTISDRQYVAVLLLLLSAASVNSRVLSHIPALSVKHADYLKLKYSHFFDAVNEKSDGMERLVDHDAALAMEFLRQGHRQDALLVFGRHVTSSRGSVRRFSSVWISVVHAVLVGTQPEELARLLFELEHGFTGLSEMAQKRIGELRQSFDPRNFLSELGSQARPLTGQIMAGSMFGVEYLGQLEYPVEIRGAVSASTPQMKFAVLCVFPDRSYQLVDVNLSRELEFSLSTTWKARNSAWSESCFVAVTLVRRFPLPNGASLAIHVEPEPVLEQGVGGLLGIAVTALAMRPKIR